MPVPGSIPPNTPFRSEVKGIFRTPTDADRTCKKCGRVFEQETSAKRPHLTSSGGDCTP